MGERVGLRLGFSASGGNVFDFFFTGTIPWFLVIGAAVITVLLVLDVLKEGQAPWPLILLAMTAVAALLLLIRLIFNPLDVPSGVDVGRGIGMILSVVSGIVAAVGGYLNFTAKGGNIKELGDMDKLKASFSKSDGTTPPPPVDPLARRDAAPAARHLSVRRELVAESFRNEFTRIRDRRRSRPSVHRLRSG